MKIPSPLALVALLAAVHAAEADSVTNEVTEADQHAYCTLSSLAPSFDLASAALPQACDEHLTSEEVKRQPNLYAGRYFQYCRTDNLPKAQGSAALSGFLCTPAALQNLTEGALAHNVFLSGPQQQNPFSSENTISCTIQLAVKGTDAATQECQNSTLPLYVKDPLPLIGDALVACSTNRTTYPSCSTQRSQTMLTAALTSLSQPETKAAAQDTKSQGEETNYQIFIR